MEFLISYCTDKGIKKLSNQDALIAKVSNNEKGRVAMFAVCDGMGGLELGEVASATVIKHLSDWYDEELLNMIYEEEEVIIKSLKNKIDEINSKILNYSSLNQIKLGTTLTLMLCIYDNLYIVQIGDSRAYKVNNTLTILTKDQTLVAREVERGTLTIEQAKNHPKRNILLQCIGVSNNMNPVITKGRLERGCSYIICSDGFYHEISESEIIDYFNMDNNLSKQYMDNICKETVELVKKRKERDNITVLLIKTK